MISAHELVEQKTRSFFREMVVKKDQAQNKYFASISLPSYLRDWVLMRFADENGKVDIDQVGAYVRTNIPSKKDWELMKGRMVNDNERLRFLAKVRVEVDVRTGQGLFSLPDLGFPSRKHEATVSDQVMRQSRDQLLSDSETWGVIQCEWSAYGSSGREGEGAIHLTDFRPFKPYRIDVEYFCDARREFSLAEWIDLLLLAVDYSPAGFLDDRQKMTLLSRLLPFVERRLNLIELAPKSTGKSYMMSQLSKYGWLVSGGSISRARLFYDVSRRAPGLVGRYDYVALDEVQTISFPDIDEIRGALKGYMESGEYRVGDYRGVGDAGILLMGNVADEMMHENRDMFLELPSAFHESALIDRFHGFIRGWDIPRIREEMKANGWGLNVEYFSEVLHLLRGEIRYPALVDSLVAVPRSGDTRDTVAVRRICSGFMKLLFPHVRSIEDIDSNEFEQYCLEPALQMRGRIRRQLHTMDSEYSDAMPSIQMRAGRARI